jgi:CheY-like chemotaxis protein
MMPVMDGRTLVEELVARGQRAQHRIVLFTAGSETVENVDSLLRKPVSLEDLQDVVRELANDEPGGTDPTL